MTAQDVEGSIIRRLRLGQPPNYLKGNQPAIDEELSLYRRALSRFDRDVLEGAWLEAASRNAYRCWPSCAAILTAAERLHEAAHPAPKPDDSWVEKATELADAYVRRFMQTSRHAARATEGGYGAELKRYVRACAWVQGQALLGREGLAYDGNALFAHCPDDKQQRDAFFQRCREQAKAGEIKVQPPLAIVKSWQREHGQGRGR